MLVFGTRQTAKQNGARNISFSKFRQAKHWQSPFLGLEGWDSGTFKEGSTRYDVMPSAAAKKDPNLRLLCAPTRSHPT